MLTSSSVNWCEAASNFRVLHNFAYSPTDGQFPAYSGLAMHSDGYFYGATSRGGQIDAGAVFKISPKGKFSLVFSLDEIHDGDLAMGGVVFDKSGNLLGAASAGGTYTYGTVYKVTPKGKGGPLYTFTGLDDGAFPQSTPIIDKHGTIYGTTMDSGFGLDCCGVIYTVKKDSFSVLFRFPSGAGGYKAISGVIEDSKGNLYGTTMWGGQQPCDNDDTGCGVVYEVSPAGVETVLHAFQGGSEGKWPHGGLARDPQGNLYGTTTYGGDPTCHCGTAFKIAPDGTFTILHIFTGTNGDGANPTSSPILDKAGNLYGTTSGGGATTCPNPAGGAFCGVVYEISASGTETILHQFSGQDGSVPMGPLTLWKGVLYGMTETGGTNASGTVFALKL